MSEWGVLLSSRWDGSGAFGATPHSSNLDHAITLYSERMRHRIETDAEFWSNRVSFFYHILTGALLIGHARNVAIFSQSPSNLIYATKPFF